MWIMNLTRMMQVRIYWQEITVIIKAVLDTAKGVLFLSSPGVW